MSATRGALFREIHKNTWLKRPILDNKKIAVAVGSIKKFEKYWVVFCVHDDCEALLEGYTEPRFAANHLPDWTVSLQTAVHISHALIPLEQEYEFVITLATDVVRFSASSWEIMQEWVDTLRVKLREMRILSPRENVYSKLPEIRPPLLPTRDPTSPLPAPPPNIPPDIVPGIERVNITEQPHNIHLREHDQSNTGSENNVSNETETNIILAEISTIVSSSTTTTTSSASSTTNSSLAMSNTSAQNLINMLSNPIAAITNYNNNINNNSENSSEEITESFEEGASSVLNDHLLPSTSAINKDKNQIKTSRKNSSLAETFANSVLFNPITRTLSSQSSISEGATNSDLISIADENPLSSLAVLKSEPIIIPRPHTSKDKTHKKSLNHDSNFLPLLSNNTEEVGPTNITIIQVSSPLQLGSTSSSNDVFDFRTNQMLEIDFSDSFKSNVQIIPSNSTAITTATTTTTTTVDNKYGPIVRSNDNGSQIVSSVQVPIVKSANTNPFKNDAQTHHSIVVTSDNSQSTVPFTVGLSSNTIRNYGPVTNIPISNNSQESKLHYEQVFITPISTPLSTPTPSTSKLKFGFINNQQNLSTSPPTTELFINRINLNNEDNLENNNNSNLQTHALTANEIVPSTSLQQIISQNNINHQQASTSSDTSSSSLQSSVRPHLSRGQTEVVITRPSRKDHLQNENKAKKIDVLKNDSLSREVKEGSDEFRRRSSSTSDAQGTRNRQANATNETRRLQPAPHPIRVDNQVHPINRISLREQQVFKLRREMAHPVGVRIQLRRRDCLNSIAFVDAFNAIWIVGWKQKEHPILYNALHIGDRLISVNGATISSAMEANKIIKNFNGLFIELIIRRVPFGRVYAIRREIEGQCLGIIRDGNTATIVDVIPKSLSARHGLPPGVKSCDGLSSTFWVLTEINGRPLNLFFKENEVRDRLNSVGLDISILVQPSDLIAKFKKQLKSMRNYKEYIVQ